MNLNYSSKNIFCFFLHYFLKSKFNNKNEKEISKQKLCKTKIEIRQLLQQQHKLQQQ